MQDWYRIGAAVFAGLVLILLGFAIFGGRQSVDTLSTRLDAIASGVDAANTAIGELKGQGGAAVTDPALQQGIADLTKAVGAANTTLADIQAKVSVAPADLAPGIADLAKSVSAANTTLADIQAKVSVAPADLAPGIADLAKSVSAANTTLADIQAKVSAPAPDLGLADLKTAVDNANAALARLEAANAKAATGDSIAGLKTDLATITQSLTDVTGRIAAQPPADNSAVLAAIADLKQTLAAIEAKLGAAVAPVAGPGFEAVMTVHYSAVNSTDDAGDVDQVVIPEVAQVIEDHRACRITVSGHADTVGSDQSNYALAERRAASVVDRLKAKFGAVDIVQKAYGERRLLGLTNDQVDELLNRRVEVSVRCAA